jgi:hypothetical protein
LNKFTNLPYKLQTEPFYLPAGYKALERRQGEALANAFLDSSCKLFLKQKLSAFASACVFAAG